MGHPQVDHGGGVAIAGGSGRGVASGRRVAAARGGGGGRGVAAAARGGRDGRGVAAAARGGGGAGNRTNRRNYSGNEVNQMLEGRCECNMKMVIR